MSVRGVKRPMRALTPQEKLRAIQRVHAGETKASVARNIGVPESTLRGWCKNEQKLAYQARQSSPDTDDTLERENKMLKLDDNMLQPFDLSTKSSSSDRISPNSAPDHAVAGCSGSVSDKSKYVVDLKQSKNRSPKASNCDTTEKKPSKDETLPLNLQANFPGISQWQWMQQQQINQTRMNNTHVPASTHNPVSTVNQDHQRQLSAVQNEFIWNWLQNLSTSSSTTTTSTSTNVDSRGLFWNWYQQMAFNHQHQQSSAAEKPILYQHPAKDQPEVNEDPLSGNTESCRIINNNNKATSVLENILVSDHNTNNPPIENKQGLSQSEAIYHGELFLKWLGTYSHPSVTAVQIGQFGNLLNNLRASAGRKDSDK